MRLGGREQPTYVHDDERGPQREDGGDNLRGGDADKAHAIQGDVHIEVGCAEGAGSIPSRAACTRSLPCTHYCQISARHIVQQFGEFDLL